MRRILLLLTAFISFTTSYSQVFNWAKSISGSFDEFASSIAVDDSLNTYVVGYFQTQITFNKSSGTIVLTSNGSYDYFISKFDCAGNAIWAVQIGGTGTEKSPYDYGGVVYNSVTGNIQVCTSIGGNATAYSMNGSNQSLTSNAFSRDIVVASYSISGNIQWINTYGGTGDDRVEAICNDAAGNVIVRGEFESSISFGSTSLTSSGAQDVYLLKLNSAGTVQWAKKEGGTGNEAANNRIMADPSGNIYVTGSTDAGLTVGSRAIVHTGAWAVYYVKYDASGNVKWVVSSGNTGSMFNPGIVVDDSYKVFISNSFLNTDTFYDASNTKITVTSNGTANDIVVFKLDSSGNFVWFKKGSSTGSELTQNLAIDKRSNLYVSGQYNGNFGFGSASQASSGSLDGFVLVLDSSGNNKDFKSFGSAGDEMSFFTIIDKTGIVYTCGGYSNTVNFGGNSLTAMGGRDAFFAKTKVDSSFTFLPNDTILCNVGSFTITPSPVPNVVTYKWSTGASTPTISVGTTGWYSLKLIRLCDSLIDSIYINFITLIPNAGADKNICLGDSVQLFATGGVTYSWTPTTGLSNPNIANPYAKPTVTTNYIVNITNSICSGKDTVKVTVNPIPTIFTNNDTAFCQGNSKVLTTSGTSNRYLWSTGDTTASITVTPSVTTTYWVRGQIGNTPCYSYDSIKITVYPLPTIIANNDTTFCAGTSKTLTANGTATRYLWNTGDTTKSITVTPSVTTTYWVRGQIGTIACFSIDTVKITVMPLPTIFTNNDTTFCLGNSKTLTANGTANHYLWSTGDTTQTITVTPTTTTTYWVRGKKDTIPCYSYDTITITVLPLPTIFTNNDTTICQGISKTLTTSGTANRFLWNTGDTTATITVKPNVTTTYWVRGQVGNIPCYSIDTVKITILGLPIINAGNDTAFCLGNSKTLTANGNANRYLWSTGDTTKTITVTPTTTTTYWVRVKIDTVPCFAFDTVVITVYPLPTIFTNNDTTFCAGTTKVLTTNGTANRFLWSTGDTTATITVTPSVTTTYWVRGQVGNIPCYSIDTVKITVLAMPTVFTSNDTTFCLGNSKTLTANGTATRYLWSTGDTTKTITVNPSVTTTYWVRGQISNVPCFALDTIKITVLPLPTIFTNNDTTFCAGTTKVLTTSGTANHWLWSTGDTTASIAVTPSVTTTYWVRGKKDTIPCYSYDTVKITVLAMPTVFTNNDTTFCLGNSKTLTANGTATRYLWSTGDTTKTITVTPSVTTTYWVRGQISNVPCFAFDTIKITILPLPTVFTNNDTTFCQGTTKVLTTSGTANHWLWSTGDTTASIAVTPLTTTTYWVRGQRDTIPCYTIDTVKLTVLTTPTIFTNNDTTFCLGNSKTLTATGTAVRYLWSTGDTTKTITVTPTVTSTYWVRGQISNVPCFAFDTIKITVLPIPTVFTNNDTTFCQGTSKILTATGNSNRYLWSTGDTTKTITVTPGATISYWVRGQNGTVPCYAFDTVTITVLPMPIVNANNDTTFCLGNSKTLTANGFLNRYLWSTGDTTQSITVTPTVTTTYWVRGQIGSNLCFSWDTIKITVLPLPTIKTNNDTSFCQGISKVLTTSGTANRYLWSTGDTTSSITVTPMVTTTYWVRGQNGTIPCYTLDTVVLNVIPLPTVNIGNDTILCDGGTKVLTAPAGMKRVWSTGDTTQSITVNIKTDTIGFTPQKFWVRVTGPGPCDNADTILLYSYCKPKITAVGGKTTICYGSTIDLIANHTPPWSTVKWSTGDSTTKLITITPKGDTTIFVNYTNKECGFADTIKIKVLPKPKLTLTPDDTICPEPKDLKVRGAKTYAWSTGATDSNITVTPTKTTTYWVIGFDGSCYSDTQSVTITVLPKATASFTANPNTGFIPLTVNFTNTSINYTGYSWSFGDGGTDTAFSPTHVYKKKGNYYARLIAFDSSGCNDTFQMLIIVENKYIMLIPSVFTPNGDGQNDVFEIEYEAILSMDGRIFNRWGELIYEWNMPDGKWWDGNNKGVEMPAGVYYYIITVVDEKNVTHDYKNVITLIR